MLYGVIYQHTKLAPCTDEQAQALVESGRACFISRDVIRLLVSPAVVQWAPVRGFRPGWPLPRGARFIIHTIVLHKVRDLLGRTLCSNDQIKALVENLTVNNGRPLPDAADGFMYYDTCNGLVFKVRQGTSTIVDVSLKTA